MDHPWRRLYARNMYIAFVRDDIHLTLPCVLIDRSKIASFRLRVVVVSNLVPYIAGFHTLHSVVERSKVEAR
jgi:hypothetical protein